MTIRAVIFDVGGVLTSSPVTAIRDYAIEAGADYGILGPMLAAGDSAWSRWERSELDTAQFMEAFEREARAAGIRISAQAVMQAAFGDQRPRLEMLRVVEYLRGRVALGCITNNVLRDEDDTRRGTLDLHGLFEVVIESSRIGLRKPDPRIYELACERLGVTPAESAFLDDLGANLKGARALGMTTIRVDHTTSAIAELEAVLGFSLPR